MKEESNLEFKEDINNNFLKTISAFANYESGDILFGVKDDGTIVGINDPDKISLDIENKINDSIKPKPNFNITINRNNNVITLSVQSGLDKPYLYKGKAYQRIHTSTVEVDHLQLRRLTLIGLNKTYEDLSYSTQNLTFKELEKSFTDILKIETFNSDILKTLGFYNEENQLNNAAALLSDKNSFPGVDIGVFGDSINIIKERLTIENQSILKQFEKAMNLFKKNYLQEVIRGFDRVEVQRIPEKAFREAIANALVHRTWDIKAHIKIEMYPNKVIISSPGGLPTGVSQEEYMNGSISILRNPIIANVFYRLKYIEMFGTGIRRIIEAYSTIKNKPIFNISEHSIQIILPTSDLQVAMNSDELMVFESLSSQTLLSSRELSDKTGFSKGKVIRIVNQLHDKNAIKVTGRGRGTKYTI